MLVCSPRLVRCLLAARSHYSTPINRIMCCMCTSRAHIDLNKSIGRVLYASLLRLVRSDVTPRWCGTPYSISICSLHWAWAASTQSMATYLSALCLKYQAQPAHTLLQPFMNTSAPPICTRVHTNYSEIDKFSDDF